MHQRSPFAKHLGTNYAPSLEEVTFLKNLVGDGKKVIRDLDQQVEDMELALAIAKARQSRYKAYIAEHEALLSPIRRVPLDILSTIFLLCLPDESNRLRESPFKLETNMTAKHPSVLLSHVCRDWRELALSTPLLWSTILVQLPRMDSQPQVFQGTLPFWPKMTANAIEVLKIWMKRSGECPLTLGFNGRSMDHTITTRPLINVSPLTIDECQKPFSDAFLASTYRWKNISFGFKVGNFSHNASLLRILHLFPEQLPLLRTANIEVRDSWVRRIGIPESNWQSNRTAIFARWPLLASPALDSLILRGPWGTLNDATHAVKHRNITSLTVNTWPAREDSDGHQNQDDVLALLKAFPQLITVSLTLQYQGQALDTAVITLPHLTSMTLKGSPANGDLASILNLPSLKKLVLDTDANWSQDRVMYSELILKFGPQLSFLSFSVLGLESTALDPYFNKLQNLTELQLAYDESFAPYEEFNMALDLLKAGACPGLQNLQLRLQLECSTSYTQLVASIAEFITSRRGAAVADVRSPLTLEAVTIAVGAPYTAVMTHDLGQLLYKRGANMSGFDLFYISNPY